MDSRYCILLLGHSLWLEIALQKGKLEMFDLEIDGMTDVKNIKRRAATRYLMEIPRGKGFIEEVAHLCF